MRIYFESLSGPTWGLLISQYSTMQFIDMHIIDNNIYLFCCNVRGIFFIYYGPDWPSP